MMMLGDRRDANHATDEQALPAEGEAATPEDEFPF
jgi:hypothetical protein